MKKQNESLNKLISNNFLNEENNKYTLIIGETPSKGARSPKLWNKAYKKLNIEIKMFPADVKKEKLRYLINYLRTDNYLLDQLSLLPIKNKY